jgi:hypothetical protein
MKTRARIWIFGTLAGLVWSIIPGILLDMFTSVGEIITILIAGAITGLLVSTALYFPLGKVKSWSGFLLGIFSLPFGAFVFGIFYFIGEMAKEGIPDSVNYFAPIYAPLYFGITLAFESAIVLYGILFLPAILTTILLQRVITSGKNQCGNS